MKIVNGIHTLEAGDNAKVTTFADLEVTIVNVHNNGTTDTVTIAGNAPTRCQLSDLVPLDIGPKHRVSDPHTSIAAAASQTPERLSKGRRAALTALANAGRTGLTDFELADRTGYGQTSIGVRRGELAKQGWVRDSGLTRNAPSQAKAIVWTITDTGIAVYRAQLDEGAA